MISSVNLILYGLSTFTLLTMSGYVAAKRCEIQLLNENMFDLLLCDHFTMQEIILDHSGSIISKIAIFVITVFMLGVV